MSQQSFPANIKGEATEHAPASAPGRAPSLVLAGDTFIGRLNARLEREPSRRAIAYCAPDASIAWQSIAEFWAEVEPIRNAIVAAGGERGRVVVISLASQRKMGVATIATLAAGAIPVLLPPPRLPVHADINAIRSVIERAKPAVVLCESYLVRSLPHDTDDPIGMPDARICRFNSVATLDAFAMQLTSGTTGAPRACVWDEQSLLYGIDSGMRAMEIGRDDICLSWVPFYHDLGLVNNLLMCLANDIPLVVLEAFDFVRNPAVWLQGLSASGATFTWASNFGYALAVEKVPLEALEGVSLAKVRGFWSGGERIHRTTLRSFAKKFAAVGVAPEALHASYGGAENVGGMTFTKPGHSGVRCETVDAKRLYEDLVAEPVGSDFVGATSDIVSVGAPHPGLEMVILSETGEHLPDGRVGQIALRTPSRFRYYLQDEAATAAQFHGPYLLMADLGYMRDGELFWVGRRDERISVRARKIDPSEFEAPLMSVRGLRPGNFVFFGVDDAKSGTQQPVLVAEFRKEAGVAPETVALACRAAAVRSLGVTLGDVVLVPAGTLLKTTSGKRRHRYYRAVYQENGFQDLRMNARP
jgi:acyl-CoA synthetase (AMP-forming)/AMP-acid ligase II